MLFKFLISILSAKAFRKKTSILFCCFIVFSITIAVYFSVKYTTLRRHEEDKLTKHQLIFKVEHLKRSALEGMFNSDQKNVENDENELQKHYLKNSNIFTMSEMGIPYVHIDPDKKYIPAKRLVHLDLKGAPLTVSYIKRILPLIRTLGATGLLIEYEDMFPFSGSLKDISAHNAYTRKDLLEIIATAKDLSLEIIPLVQTFGHLEFALKRPSLKHLREVYTSPQALCPSMNESLVFIENMISQVMEVHGTNIKYLHIGCDEVYHLGECKLCKKGIRDNSGRSRDALFLKHVQNVANMISRRWPSIRPLIWDDMLRHVSQDLLAMYNIGKYVDPMIWVYIEDIYRFIPSTIWDKYAAVFDTAWSASAFKGAFGETLNVPNAQRHLENNLQWLRVMAAQEGKFKNGFAGIVATGWQRYDHFAVLCELFPASVPSLGMVLLGLSHGIFDQAVLDSFGATMGCPSQRQLDAADIPHFFVNLVSDPHMWDRLGNCFFPGAEFFKLTYRLQVADSEALDYVDQVTRQRGWLTPYNVRHNFTSAERVAELAGAGGEGARILRALAAAADGAARALDNVTDRYTVAEWVEQRLYTRILEVEKVIAHSKSVLNRITWERRPLKPLADLKRFGITVPNSRYRGQH